MAVISFAQTDSKIWLVAHWAHRRFLTDVIACFPDDTEMEHQLERAIALDGLHLHMLERDFASRIVKAMRIVASATINGTEMPCLRWKEGLDDEGQQMYREGISGLLRLIKEEIDYISE